MPDILVDTGAIMTLLFSPIQTINDISAYPHPETRPQEKKLQSARPGRSRTNVLKSAYTVLRCLWQCDYMCVMCFDVTTAVTCMHLGPILSPSSHEAVRARYNICVYNGIFFMVQTYLIEFVQQRFFSDKKWNIFIFLALISFFGTNNLYS